MFNIESISRTIRLIEFFLFKNLYILKPNKGFVIIGCGRSGTTYTAKVLKKNGVEIGHERILRNGLCSWYLVSDQRKVPFGPSFHHLSYLRYPIVHQVRHPVRSVSSMLSAGSSSWQFLAKEIPIDLENDSKVLRAMKYWYYWNLKAEDKSCFTYQIEQFEEVTPILLQKAGIASEEFKDVDLVSVSKNTNTRQHLDLTWEDLYNEDAHLCEKIKNLARKYGYSIQE